jgi:hypothetical protein
MALVDSLPVKTHLSGYYNAVTTDFGADWQIRAQVQFILVLRPFGTSHLQLWRQGLELPYVKKHDSRMTPNTFEAYLLSGPLQIRLRDGVLVRGPAACLGESPLGPRTGRFR